MSAIEQISAAALAADQARLERIANNLANVQTPGYKRQLAMQGRGASESAFDLAVDAIQRKAGATLTPPAVMLERATHAGSLRPTGRSLDLALTAPGYFEVATRQGPIYTRTGSFQLDARGRVVDQQGNPLVGRSGEINLVSDSVRINPDGRVFEGDKLVAEIKVVDLQSQGLREVGPGQFSGDGVQELQPGEIAMRQGALENSNVSPAQEMVSLSTTVRHFEAMVRMVQARDDLIGTAIRKLTDA